jgi:hypothetical protein
LIHDRLIRLQAETLERALDLIGSAGCQAEGIEILDAQ